MEHLFDVRRGLGTVVCTVALTACGTAEPGLSGEPTSAPDVRLYGDCRADDPALDGADVIAEADIDGADALEEIAYVPESAGRPCGNSLFTTVRGEPTAMSLGDDVLDADSAGVVQLQGSDSQLLLVRGQSHPRGGFTLHLLGHGDDGLAEVTVGAEPMLGFVATDGGGLPATAQCADDGGIVTFNATTDKPPGIVLAWDVRATTYSLDGTAASEVTSEQTRDAAVDPLLRKEMPQLFDPEAYFADCLVERVAR